MRDGAGHDVPLAMFGTPQNPDYWRAADELGFGQLALNFAHATDGESLRLLDDHAATGESVSRLDAEDQTRDLRDGQPVWPIIVPRMVDGWPPTSRRVECRQQRVSPSGWRAAHQRQDPIQIPEGYRRGRNFYPVD